jgi:glycosyltransferase involved in cell wall biosynthesis
MRILIATDAFPPVCGGSGWSTYELARGLRSRGHTIEIVQPRPQAEHVAEPLKTTSYDGFDVTEFRFQASTLPFARNYDKSERLTARLSAYLADRLKERRHDLVHAQHVMTAPPAITAARKAGVPVVATVRDYWPVCYWSDLLYTRSGLGLCPECTVGNMTRCVRPRAGAAWPLALPMIPYMRANLARKQRTLADADAVIAVSRRIADDLRARATGLGAMRIETIPNPVNVRALRTLASTRPTTAAAPDGPYALYLGKIAPNKGTSYLLPAIEAADLDWPLIVAGDGPDRHQLEQEAAASGRDVRFVGWIDQGAAAGWLGHAAMLLFPSRGPESLSRVLLEASALGLPIAAMDTGGTRDIIEPGVTGLLSSSPEEFAEDVRTLRQDEALRGRLGVGARRKVESEFDADVVVARVERLYMELVGRP